jgi:hypothetical protein
MKTEILYLALIIAFLRIVVDPYREKPLKQIFFPDWLKEDRAQKRGAWENKHPGSTKAGDFLSTVVLGLVLLYFFLEYKK